MMGEREVMQQNIERHQLLHAAVFNSRNVFDLCFSTAVLIGTCRSTCSFSFFLLAFFLPVRMHTTWTDGDRRNDLDRASRISNLFERVGWFCEISNLFEFSWVEIYVLSVNIDVTSTTVFTVRANHGEQKTSEFTKVSPQIYWLICTYMKTEANWMKWYFPLPQNSKIDT